MKLITKLRQKHEQAIGKWQMLKSIEGSMRSETRGTATNSNTQKNIIIDDEKVINNLLTTIWTVVLTEDENIYQAIQSGVPKEEDGIHRVRTNQYLQNVHMLYQRTITSDIILLLYEEQLASYTFWVRLQANISKPQLKFLCWKWVKCMIVSADGFYRDSSSGFLFFIF